MTAKTPLYGLEYLTVGEPVRNTRAALESNARTIEAALAARGVPPSDLQTLIAAGWFSDTGWVVIPSREGQAPQGGVAPQVRKVGRAVFMRWGWSAAPPGKAPWAANSSYIVGDIPAGFRPAQGTYVRCGTSSANIDVQGVINSDGRVEVRTGATAPGYALFDGISWPVG